MLKHNQESLLYPEFQSSYLDSVCLMSIYLFIFISIFFYKKQASGASSTKPAPVNDAGPVSDDKMLDSAQVEPLRMNLFLVMVNRHLSR